MRRALALLAVLSAPLCAPSPARATTIDPMPWEELVARADFVGVVECETAGGIVARYRVIESWKGAAVGTSVTIRVAVNYWEPQYPLALVGERWLVNAFASRAPSRMMSTTSGGPVPLWWRQIQADYELPLFQGRSLVTGTRVEEGDVGETDLDKLRRETQAFIGAAPEERERTLYQILVKKEFPEDRRLRRLPVKRLVRVLVQRARKQREGRLARELLERAGGPVTLAELERQRDPDLRALADPIRARLQGIRPPPRPPRPADPPPSPVELARLRTLVAGTPTEEQFLEAFAVLARRDREAPGPVEESAGRLAGR